MKAKVFGGSMDAIATRLREEYPSPATLSVLVLPVAAEADERTAQCLSHICEIVASTVAARESKRRQKLIELLMDIQLELARQSQPASH